ncbi:hypothetical protein [Kitasatospora sp. NPDC057223]|uniref:hypothetical protein n=1 Tax=Kitasatospora sp. NPDC057223 TaxID=3346055 RepID=UPI0036394822
MERKPLVRALVAACIFLVGLVAGLTSGALSRASGTPWPTAVRDGGTAFGTTIAVGIAVALFFYQE